MDKLTQMKFLNQIKKRLSNLAFVLILILNFCCVSKVNAVNSKNLIKGELAIDLTQKLRSNIDIYLYKSGSIIDSTKVDYEGKFEFDNLVNSYYRIDIVPNAKVLGYIGLSIDEILVDSNNKSIKIYPIKLLPRTTCGCSSFILGKKSNEEYYDTGELYGEGSYNIERRRYGLFKLKRTESEYNKNGLWNYYYKSGELQKEELYDNGDIISIKHFYKNSNLKIQGNYQNCKSGVWEYYSENNSKIFIVDFSNRLMTKIKNEYLENYFKNIEVLSL